MYGIPEPHELSFLIGKELQQVCFGRNETILHFFKDVSITIMCLSEVIPRTDRRVNPSPSSHQGSFILCYSKDGSWRRLGLTPLPTVVRDGFRAADSENETTLSPADLLIHLLGATIVDVTLPSKTTLSILFSIDANLLIHEDDAPYESFTISAPNLTIVV